MAKAKKVSKYQPSNPEAVEQEMIYLAINQAKMQLEQGIAPASTVNYFLKLASSREKIEQEMLAKQISLLEAKVENIKNSEVETQTYLDAIEAIKKYGYSGIN